MVFVKFYNILAKFVEKVLGELEFYFSFVKQPKEKGENHQC